MYKPELFRNLLHEQLVNGRYIFEVNRRRKAGKRFKIPYKMRLVEIAAVVSNSRKGLVIFSNKLQAELKPVYFIE